ncbi:eCIS core domain-containing protein [Spirosoma pollinicola]|uniref:DUF4157 domain-containing protein n=1 Tax=Spirosoma pollinicola TaxID=2057025 RepID=A0A2K8Z4Q0_9BACT|nr:DUF4157 domain-containing protein [Spirosoma pollinicola]AUD04877.1 hypothetical protein CWM47_25350 [Spirosoma pollinicola]
MRTSPNTSPREANGSQAASPTRTNRSFFDEAASSLFFSPVTVQPKLVVGASNDAYEQEADAMASRVMTMNDPASISSPSLASVSPATIQRKCAHCEEEEKKIQRKESSNTETTASADVSYQLTSGRSGGSPLPNQTRGFMENALSADFSNVRLHTDAKAVQLSRQLNAHAFTYGNDVYFNNGQYAPDSRAGKQLLAHELTHVVQQNAGIQRKRIQREPTATVDNVPGACSFDQHHQIEPAVRQATTWLRATIRRLDTFIGSPAREPGVQAALERHFHSSTAETAGRVRRIFGRIDSEILSRPDLQVECHTTTDTSCNAAGAYVTGNLFVFCPAFFNGSANWQAISVIHEMAHTLTGVTHITDRAYQSDRYYRMQSTMEALTNAASYENFCLEVGTNTPQPTTAPRDETNDCNDRQATPIRRSLAQLERWNRNAQNITSDTRPGMLSQWQDLQTSHLGGTAAANILQARRVYDLVYSRLGSSVTLECERSCDRNVTGYYRYFLFITSDTIHVCPMLFSLNEDDRTIEIYRLILMRYGDVSESTSLQLATLAKSVNDRFWAPPTSLTGFD